MQQTKLINLPLDVLDVIVGNNPKIYWRLAVTIKGYATEKVVERKKKAFVSVWTETDDDGTTFSKTYLGEFLHSFNDEPSETQTNGNFLHKMWHNYGKIHRIDDANGDIQPASIEKDTGYVHSLYYYKGRFSHADYVEDQPEVNKINRPFPTLSFVVLVFLIMFSIFVVIHTKTINFRLEWTLDTGKTLNLGCALG